VKPIVVIQEVLLVDYQVHYEKSLKEYLQLVHLQKFCEDMELGKFDSIEVNTLKKHQPGEILLPNLRSIKYILIKPQEKK
jgi:hypothetical protein